MFGRKAAIYLLFLCFIVLVFLAGCDLFGPENGTITIILTGAEDYNGMPFTYRMSNCSSVVDSCDDPSVFCGSVIIVDGRVEIGIADSSISPGIQKEFEADECFSISGYIDADNSGGDPVGGVDYALKSAYSDTVDGDMIADLSYPDDFKVSDNGFADMALYQGLSMLMRGGLNNLGTGYENFLMSFEITIKNMGTALMELSGTPLVSLSGAASTYFSISIPPAETSLMPEETTDFTLQILFENTGYYSAIVTIPYNDQHGIAYMLSFSITIEEPVIRLPKTGQVTIFKDGDDGDISAGAAWPIERFVNNLDGTVTDLLTGRMWQGTPPYSTYSTAGYSWDRAVDFYVNNCSLGGYTDWHLPNVNELMSMVHAGESSPAAWLNSIDGFSGIRNDEYWTSTRGYSSGSVSSMGWVVDMKYGKLGRQNIAAYGSFAMFWLVREAVNGAIELPKTGKTANFRPKDDGALELGASWPSPRFIINDGLVFDALTGLLWKQDPHSSYLTWDEAITHAENLEYGGFTDWRLPNRNEMRSLVSYGTSSNDTYLSGRLETTIPDGKFWWTSTTYASSYSGNCRAWVLYLDTGNSVDMPKTDKKYCWVVRDL
jgi:Protein of unknown function (DUF1566)